MGDYIVRNGELMHYGVKGMKWGVRKKVAKFVERTVNSEGYKKALRSIMGNKAINKAANRLTKHNMREVPSKTVSPNGRQRDIARATRGIDKDIQSFKPYTETGIITKHGKLVLSSEDVNASIKALEMVKNKKISEINARYDKKVNAINRDIESYRPHAETGIRTKDGKVVITREDVASIIAGLENTRKKYE